MHLFCCAILKIHVNLLVAGSYSGLRDLLCTRERGFEEISILPRFAHNGHWLPTSRSSRQPPTAPTIRQSHLNIGQETVHTPL